MVPVPAAFPTRFSDVLLLPLSPHTTKAPIKIEACHRVQHRLHGDGTNVVERVLRCVEKEACHHCIPSLVMVRLLVLAYKLGAACARPLTTSADIYSATVAYGCCRGFVEKSMGWNVGHKHRSSLVSWYQSVRAIMQERMHPAQSV